jgi:hypothetical protein
MFEAWKEKNRREKEAKWLADIHARDADVGVPSPQTLTERMTKAAVSRMWDVVDDCLQKGADINEQLTVSREWGKENRLPGLGSKGGLRLYKTRDMSLVCIAVFQNDVKAAQNLLAQGGNPDEGYSGWDESFTPLSIAVRNNNPAMVQLLCDNGADLSWDRPLRLAEKNGYNDIIKIIRTEEAKRAQGTAAPPPPAATPAEQVLRTLEKLSDAERAKLLAVVNEKFAPPKPADAALTQDVTVMKTLSVKKPAATA